MKRANFSTTVIYVRKWLLKGQDPIFWFALPTDQLLICFHDKQSIFAQTALLKFNIGELVVMPTQKHWIILLLNIIEIFNKCNIDSKSLNNFYSFFFNSPCEMSLFSKRERSLIFSGLKKSSFLKSMLLLNFPIRSSSNILNKNNISMMLNKCLIRWFWFNVTI